MHRTTRQRLFNIDDLLLIIRNSNLENDIYNDIIEYNKDNKDDKNHYPYFSLDSFQTIISKAIINRLQMTNSLYVVTSRVNSNLDSELISYLNKISIDAEFCANAFKKWFAEMSKPPIENLGFTATQIIITPLDLNSINDLNLPNYVKRGIYKWPMELMFNAPYTSAKLHISDIGEISKYEIEWIESDDLYVNNKKRYYEAILQNACLNEYCFKINKHRGQWAIFNSDGSNEITENVDHAMALKKDNKSFVTRILYH
jgi:hypothetical protein